MNTLKLLVFSIESKLFIIWLIWSFSWIMIIELGLKMYLKREDYKIFKIKRWWYVVPVIITFYIYLRIMN